MRLINHHYEIPFEPVFDFDYTFRNGPVGYEGYQSIEKEIPLLSVNLRDNRGSRQVIHTLNNKTYMSCLVSIQWLLDDTTLHCIVNFRSQHHTLGVPTDSLLLNYLCTEMMSRLMYYGIEISTCKISVNVADYHDK